MESNESPIVNSATLTQVLPSVERPGTLLPGTRYQVLLLPGTRYQILVHFSLSHTALCITSSRKHWSTRLSMSTAAWEVPKDDSGEFEFEGEQALLYNSTKLPGCEEGEAPE